MQDGVVIDAWAPDNDPDVRLLDELGRALAQRDEVERAPPGRRWRAECGDP
jgi:hypothetical protein